jgi:hypothetical protein
MQEARRTLAAAGLLFLYRRLARQPRRGLCHPFTYSPGAGRDEHTLAPCRNCGRFAVCGCNASGTTKREPITESDRPSLLDTTNGLLRGSTGIELQWRVPGIQVPVRGYYAVNVLRLNRFLALPGGSVFHAHSRFSVFGWALGTLF